MFQVSTRRFSVVALRGGAKSKAPVAIRCFSSAENSDAVVEVKTKIPTYSDPIATVDMKSLTYEGIVKLTDVTKLYRWCFFSFLILFVFVVFIC